MTRLANDSFHIPYPRSSPHFHNFYIPLPFPEWFLTVSFPRRGGSVVGDSDWTLENTKVKIEGVKHISSLPPPSAYKPQNIYRTIFKPRKVEIRRRRAARGVAQPHETHNDSVISLRPEEKETEKERESARENFERLLINLRQGASLRNKTFSHGGTSIHEHENLRIRKKKREKG